MTPKLQNTFRTAGRLPQDHAHDAGRYRGDRGLRVHVAGVAPLGPRFLFEKSMSFIEKYTPIFLLACRTLINFRVSDNPSARLFRGHAYQVWRLPAGSGTLISRARLSDLDVAFYT